MVLTFVVMERKTDDKPDIIKIIEASFAIFAAGGLLLWYMLEKSHLLSTLYLQNDKFPAWFEYWVLLVLPGIVLYYCGIWFTCILLL